MPSIGPQLPPAAVEKRKRDDEGEKQDTTSSTDSVSKRSRVLGPAPPPAPLDERPSVPPTASEPDDEDSSTDSGDDDDFGPALPGAIDAKAASAPKPSANLESQPLHVSKRDEWMTLAPESGDWSARVDPTKLKNRKFGSSKSPSRNVGGGDSWHETPEQKQARLQREMMGMKDNTKPSPSPTISHEKDAEDENTRKRIKEYNAARGPSLYDTHQGKTKTEKEDDPSARAFDRDKDIGGGLQVNSTQRREMMKKASDFGSRFSSGKYL